MYRLNARLDEELAKKVQFIKRRTRQSDTEIIKMSLDLYYRHLRSDAEASPRDALVDLIGCADGPPDLSTHYKDLLSASLAHKS